MRVKGILLAGGTGSRLGALARGTNKHLLPIGPKPMILYSLEQLLGMGIEDVLVVTSPEHADALAAALGDGRGQGCRITWGIQDRPGGVAHALGLGRTFAAGDRVVVLLGDNLFQHPLKPHLDRFLEQPAGARVLLKAVRDPRRFGVAEIAGDRVVRIEEKPAEPRSRLAVVGAYFYDAAVFGIIDALTGVNDAYARAGLLRFDPLDGWWTDAGTPRSLARARRLVAG
jgi:glucose-1-phosphate thymidylyltransferase